MRVGGNVWEGGGERRSLQNPVFRAEPKCFPSKANKRQLAWLLCLGSLVCINHTLCTFITCLNNWLKQALYLFRHQQLGKDISSCFEQWQPLFSSCNLLMLREKKILSCWIPFRSMARLLRCLKSQSLEQQAVKMPDLNVTFKVWVLVFQSGFQKANWKNLNILIFEK